MLWEANKAVPEGNDPVPQKEELGSGQPTLADIYRLCVERFDRMDSYFDRLDKKLDEISEMRKMTSMLHAWSLKLGSHVLSWRQTGPQILRRLATHEGRRNSSTSNAWGLLFCTPG